MGVCCEFVVNVCECEFAVSPPLVCRAFTTCSLRGDRVYTVCLLRGRCVLAMRVLPCVLAMRGRCVLTMRSAVWLPCVRRVPSSSFLCVHCWGCVFAVRVTWKRADASPRSQAPSGFRRIHLRWPRLPLPRQNLRRRNRLRHEGEPPTGWPQTVRRG